VAIPIAPRPDNITPAPTIAPSSHSGSSTSPPASRPMVVRKLQRPIQAQRPVSSQRRRQSTPPALRPPPAPHATPRSHSLVHMPSPTTYRPGGFAFDAQEGQYFQVFRTHTANELSGFFDSDFWTMSVLQESHSEASIRHAVVALGALYKTLEKASESPPGSPDDSSLDTAPSHYNFALLQYGKALTRLRESIGNNETRSQRTILISIVLFTCFQSFTGDHRAAISQIQHGLGLLEERRQDSKQPLIHRKEDIVEDELIQIFTRLAIQAKSYDMAFHFPQPYVIRLSQPQRIDPASPQSPSSPSDATSTASMDAHLPEIFRSLHDARQALDSITERMMRFNELLSSYHLGPNNILPRSVLSSGNGFKMQLDQWDRAFQPLLETRRRPGVNNTERAGIDVLKMMHIMTTILFLMSFSTSEMEFDKFTPHFNEIVKLAEEVVVDEELTLAQARCGDMATCRHKEPQPHMSGYHFPGLTSHQPGAYRPEDSYAHIKASFALDLGIVPPLFVVATKCRHRKLRREAIRLLMSSPRREGMWDSILSGRVGQWIMEIEEEFLSPYHGSRNGPAAEIVPDDKRVMVKEILFDMQRREATLRCGTRGAREGDLDMRAKETHISW
jgi:hypothetical protein